ncbi:uncharacterized protein LOC121390904 [Gigantopelta aegis]|uniref:uncharacterized protein LOC121390904 n=1 Tax=Gigantopelta aegis TaxID=1735272 RepID=UPI001B88DB93|nr:uncharacterized protein LOC121390904 [Gigantopelta aegis]
MKANLLYIIRSDINTGSQVKKMSLKEMQVSIDDAKTTSERLRKLRKQLAPPIITPQNIPEFTIPPSYKQLSSQNKLQCRLPIQKIRKIEVTSHSTNDQPYDNKDDFFKRISMTNILPNHISKSIWDMLKQPEWDCLPSTELNTKNEELTNEEPIQNKVIAPSWASVLQKPAPGKGSPATPQRSRPAEDLSKLDCNLHENCSVTSSIKGDNCTSNWDPLYGTRGSEEQDQADEEIVDALPVIMAKQILNGMPPMAKTYAMCLTADVVITTRGGSSRTASVENILPTVSAWPKQFICRPTVNNKE